MTVGKSARSDGMSLTRREAAWAAGDEDSEASWTDSAGDRGVDIERRRSFQKFTSAA
jgi:hypothetical protein